MALARLSVLPSRVGMFREEEARVCGSLEVLLRRRRSGVPEPIEELTRWRTLVDARLTRSEADRVTWRPGRDDEAPRANSLYAAAAEGRRCLGLPCRAANGTDAERVLRPAEARSASAPPRVE